MVNDGLKTLHLFAGAGGGLLSDLILGHRPICAVEIDPYCCAVLRERAAAGWFPDMQVFEGDVRVFPASDWKGRVGIIHAGVPCQPWSVAGKREGESDERNLWPDTLRIIGEVGPRYVLMENVPGIVSWNGGEYLAWILGNLSSLGYDARWTVLGADQVGAPHRRDRWWCLAYANSTGVRSSAGNTGDRGRPASQAGPAGLQEKEGRQPEAPIGDAGPAGQDVAHPTIMERQSRSQKPGEIPEVPGNKREHDHAGGPGENVADAQGVGQREQADQADAITRGGDAWIEFGGGGWWDIEPNLGRVANGVPFRVDRLKGLGNAQVPLQAAAAWEILTAGL